jgi:predicted TIM-barrel enzyme
MIWIKELFGVEKPIIGMAHFKPLPGDPRYDPAISQAKAAEILLRDVEALQAGGVDGIMFSNEGSQPWMLNPPAVTAVTMAALIGWVRSTVKLPFGVHVIWDPQKTVELAAAVGAQFAWETFTAARCYQWQTAESEIETARVDGEIPCREACAAFCG